MNMIALLLALLTTTSAHAGSNFCEGTVAVGKEWTKVVGVTGDYAPDGCRFLTASQLGRRILRACPNGSECRIEMPLNRRSPTLTNILHVEREQ